MKEYNSILVISDLHSPFMHQDTVPFLKAVKNRFKPDLVINIGDEIDGHSWSYHEKDQSLPNPDLEISLAIKKLKPIYKLFPNCHVIDSNHGSLAIRKSKTNSIPNAFIRPNKEVIKAPQGWTWHKQLYIKMSNGNMVKFVHGIGSNAWKSAKDLGISLVQGHYHTKLFSHIEFVQSLNKTIFALQVGCLIDDYSMAFAYNKTIAKRPSIGCGVIVRGIPMPIAMIRDKHNRWVGLK